MTINIVPEDETPEEQTSGVASPARGFGFNRTFDDAVSDLPETGFSVAPSHSDTDGDGGDESGFGVAGPVTDSPAEIKKRRVKMSKEMRKAMNKLKKNISDYPSMFFDARSKQHPEWQLDKNEKETLRESIEFALEILDIEFEIEAISITLTSIWWIIAYPIAVFGMMFLTHREAVISAHPEDFIKEDK
jgi:hypothetical protein